MLFSWSLVLGCGSLTYWGDDLRRLEQSAADTGLADTGSAPTEPPPTGTTPTGEPAPAPLAITSIVPASGATVGGTVVTVSGTFEPGTTLAFDGIAATIQSQTATALQAITPAHAAGLVDVTVSAGARTATLSDGFQYFLDGDPPALTTVKVIPYLDHVEVKFGYTDGDGPMDGGTLQVTDGTVVWNLAVPDDLAEWDPLATSIGVISPWTMLDCGGVSANYTVTAIDADGRPSDPVDVPLEIEGFGDLPEIVGDHAVNPTETTWTACVTFDDATSLADDEDIAFTADSGGSTSFYFGWEDVIDGDLTLRPAAAPATLLAYSAEYGDVWESFSYSMTAGEAYIVQMRLYAVYMGEVPPFQTHLLVRKN